MKRMLNTLYVTTQGSYLSREGETVLVHHEREVKLRIPVHTLGGLVCFGQVSCSPFLLGLCAERDVAVSFLTQRGRFLARVQGPVSGNVLLRREQYRQADDEDASARIAQAIVMAKISNCRSVLLRAARERPPDEGTQALAEAAEHLARLLRKLEEPAPLDTCRSWEGDAARTYFAVFDHLITSQKEDFFFHGRSRRPPLDNMNALLSFLYTLLLHDASSALQTVGLDPTVGYLHRDRPGRPGMALDLMEEFRPFLADRRGKSLCEPVRGIIQEKLEVGLSAQRIWQDLRAEHGFQGSYSSVKRFVRKLCRRKELPFRRMECSPGEEAQVDFGTGAWVIDSDGRRRQGAWRVARHAQTSLSVAPDTLSDKLATTGLAGSICPHHTWLNGYDPFKRKDGGYERTTNSDLETTSTLGTGEHPRRPPPGGQDESARSRGVPGPPPPG